MSRRLQVSFVEQPETVDFEVSVMGGSTLSGLIPSLKAWIVGFARDSLINMYVMPEHWTYRLDPVSFLPLLSFSWVLCLPVYHDSGVQIMISMTYQRQSAIWRCRM